MENLQPSSASDSILRAEGPPAANSASAWINRLFHCNPFYLLSAALLLYAIYAISTGPQSFPTEKIQLLFNFSSLQVYSAMLVATALMLARRKIWYDSTLLVVLENLLIWVPFILVSHASFMEGSLAQSLCLAGGAAAAVKLGLIKRFFPTLNIPVRMLVCGIAFLAANIVLPLVFRKGLEFGEGVWTNNELWTQRSVLCWNFVLPALVFIGLALPPRKSEGAPREAHEKQFLPPLVFALWICATGVHLYSIGYIDDQKLAPSLFIPAVWALGWLFWARGIAHFEMLRPLATPFLILPAALPLLAVLSGRPGLAVSLLAINAITFLVLSTKPDSARFCLGLSAASILGALLCAPSEWLAKYIAGYNKGYVVLGVVAIASLVQSLRLRTPKAALLGGVSVLALLLGAFGVREATVAAAIQSACCFVMLHSLWWQEPLEKGSDLFKSIVLAAWCAHSISLQQSQAWLVTWIPAISAAVVILALLGARLCFNRFSPLFLGGAGVIILVKPFYLFAFGLKQAPAGVLPLIASFVLFALGTALALNRRRFSPSAGAPSTGAPQI